jgi:putative tryptophan/tyrosine transport system substrate-binding protein
MDILNRSICWFVKNTAVILFALLVSICLIPGVKAEDKILSIQSSTITPYEEAIRGFQSKCGVSIDRFIISEMKDKDIAKEIRKASPSIILAVGMDAIEKTKEIHDTPVVFMMMPNTPSAVANAANFTGVRMNIPQEMQLLTFLKAFPEMKSIGLLYDPSRSGFIAEKAIAVCKKEGINVISKEIHSPRETPAAINEMKGRVDGFWMLPDPGVYTSETIEYLFLFSIGNRVPILTFSEMYLESGALISIGVDPFDMGSQAGEMALDLLTGKPVSAIPPVDARKEVVSINMKVSQKFGISIDEKLFIGAKFLK